MFDPSRILAQARQPYLPTGWQVFIGKRPHPLAVGCFTAFLAAFFILFCSIAATFVAAIVFGGFLATSSASRFDPTSSDLLPIILVVAVIAIALILVAGIVGGLRGARDRRDPLPLLAITPEGFVEYVNSRKPPTAVAFADLLEPRLRVHTTTTHHYNTPGDPSSGTSHTSSSTSIWLDLVYRNGQTRRWRPGSNFGSPATVIQAIIAAHARYSAARP